MTHTQTHFAIDFSNFYQFVELFYPIKKYIRARVEPRSTYAALIFLKAPFTNTYIADSKGSSTIVFKSFRERGCLNLNPPYFVYRKSMGERSVCSVPDNRELFNVYTKKLIWLVPRENTPNGKNRITQVCCPNEMLIDLNNVKC